MRFTSSWSLGFINWLKLTKCVQTFLVKFLWRSSQAWCATEDISQMFPLYFCRRKGSLFKLGPLEMFYSGRAVFIWNSTWMAISKPAECKSFLKVGTRKVSRLSSFVFDFVFVSVFCVIVFVFVFLFPFVIVFAECKSFLSEQKALKM